MKPLFTYNGLVTKVIDGDTIDATIDLGFSVFVKERFRLYGIDTPEKNSHTPELKRIAIEATDYVKKTLNMAPVIIQCIGKDKYGRWLAKVNLVDQLISINEQLVCIGYAKAYFGDSKVNLGW